MPLGSGKFTAIFAVLTNAFRVMMKSESGRWLVSALAFVGLQWTANKVITDVIANQVRAHMQTTATGDFAVAASQWLGVLRLDQAVTMLLSAIVIKRGLTATKVALSRKQT